MLSAQQVRSVIQGVILLNDKNIENNCYINIRPGNPEAKVQTIVGAFEVN